MGPEADTNRSGPGLCAEGLTRPNRPPWVVEISADLQAGDEVRTSVFAVAGQVYEALSEFSVYRPDERCNAGFAGEPLSHFVRDLSQRYPRFMVFNVRRINAS